MSETISQQPRWMRRFSIFWRVILLTAFGLAIFAAFEDDPALFSTWRGAMMVLLVGSYLAVYEWYERIEVRRSGHWPVPYRTVLLYLAVQLAIMIPLFQFNSGFTGPVFMLMGQVVSSLPVRKWPIPLAAIMVLGGAGGGLIESVYASSWGEIVSFLFFMVLWVGLAVFISILFYERHQRERLIVDLRKAKEQLEHYAIQAEELAALRERARLAREMHDSLGHALVVVNVKLEAAQRLYAVDATRGDAELEATRMLVRETMAELRRSLTNLRAALLDQQDLPAALQRIAEDIRARSSLEITCSVQPELSSGATKLAPETTEALWRVAREALTNVERHAAAASAALTVERMNGTLILRVVDDGSGVAPADLARAGHYGITGMRERVEALGGTLLVAARPGGGTLVEAHLPAVEH
jgi:signal transduction histidine kinase